MSLTFYHYVHCPFCVRVRMALGYLKLPYKSVVVAYDDENTPMQLTGKKMLPILQDKKGAMNESLDIVHYVDEKNIFQVKETIAMPEYKTFEDILGTLGNFVHSLAMPYWIWTPEFNESSRAYFQNKKEEKRGPFRTLYSKRREFISQLSPHLENLHKDLRPFYRSDKFTLYDILLASHLWGLYVVPEFQFSPQLHEYLQRVRELCSFDYHQDFWS